MCGIVGYAGMRINQAVFQKMNDSISHRGPDDSGMIQYNHIGLAMRRLSIIDIGGGHQPIFSEDKNFVIIYNGEIYNYRELKKTLEGKGHVFKTSSDTEVFLHLYMEYGPEGLQKINGMFTVAIYNKQRDELFVARDRLGIKPLYYWQEGKTFLFASEIKPFTQCPHILIEPNHQMVNPFLSLRYVPGPESLIRGILKFPAAHFALWKNGTLNLRRYWSPFKDKRKDIAQAEAQEEFNDLFEAAVKRRMVADVPLGAFLSGGLDSSAIVNAMSKQSNQPIKTFSVGFDWEGDELNDAAKVAKYLGCDHEEIVCKSDDFRLLPQILWYLDEPVGDPITLPMFLLAKGARKKAKVVLSGEGADEVLAGYFPHRALMLTELYKKYTPNTLKNGFIPLITRSIPSSILNHLFDYPAELGEKGKKKLLNFIGMVNKGSLPEEYRYLISLFDDEDKKNLYKKGGILENLWNDQAYGLTELTLPKNYDYLDRVLSLQYRDWLPDDILNKADKMLMGNSIEGRVPFMDHTLVEFLSSLPSSFKLKGKKNKALLRNYLKMNLPTEVSKRKKKAFYVPMEQYTKGSHLMTLIGECLNESAVRKRGIFNHKYVTQLVSSLGQGEFIYDKQVFCLLTLEIWYRLYIDHDKSLLSI